MEIARMNYYFTGLIILALTMLALFVEPAYPRNEYLNEYGVRCGEFETRIEAEDRNGKYNHYNDTNKLKLELSARLGLLLTLLHIFINSNCCLIATFSFAVLQSVPKYFLYVNLRY